MSEQGKAIMCAICVLILNGHDGEAYDLLYSSDEHQNLKGYMSDDEYIGMLFIAYNK